MLILVWLQTTLQEFKNMGASPENVELLLKIITGLLVLLAGAWGWFVTRTVKRIDILERSVAEINGHYEVDLIKATASIIERLARMETVLTIMGEQMEKLNKVVYED